MLSELKHLLREGKINLGVVKRTAGKVVVEVQGIEIEVSSPYKCQIGDRVLVDLQMREVVKVFYRSKTYVL